MKIIILNFTSKVSFDNAYQNWAQDKSQLMINEINFSEKMMNFESLPDDEGGILETASILQEELDGIEFLMSAEERISIPLNF
jgi:hypothetical protein